MLEVLLLLERVTSSCWLDEKSIKSSSSKFLLLLYPSSASACLYLGGLKDGGCGDVETVETERDRIHRRTAAIPLSSDARRPLAFTSSSIVSEREPELTLLCLREEDEVVVTVEFEVDDAVATDGTKEDVVVVTLLFVLLPPPPPPPRLRDSEFALGAVPSGSI
jgi:hypothetical protein